MKSTFKYMAFLGALIFLVSCSNDDEGTGSDLKGTGDVKLTFDNGVGDDDLLLGSSYTNSQGETLTIDRLNYIVGNFRLTDADGNVFTYPKDQSFFIISEETGATEVVLHDVPAGKYESITFGIGVDQEKYLQGAEGQGDLLTEAEDNEMMWSWQAGYKFLNFEGTFTSATVTDPTEFKIHMGSHGSSLDNYKETTLNFGTDALVGEGMEPIVHMVADANAILDGGHKLALSEQAVVMISEEKSPQIAENVSTMFRVDHVHNGDGSAH